MIHPEGHYFRNLHNIIRVEKGEQQRVTTRSIVELQRGIEHEIQKNDIIIRQSSIVTENRQLGN
jgi:hypothetical protein